MVEAPVPEELKAEVEAKRTELIEYVSEVRGGMGRVNRWKADGAAQLAATECQKKYAWQSPFLALKSQPTRAP